MILQILQYHMTLRLSGKMEIHFFYPKWSLFLMKSGHMIPRKFSGRHICEILYTHNIK